MTSGCSPVAAAAWGPKAAVSRAFTPFRQTSGPMIRRSTPPITTTELITNSL